MRTVIKKLTLIVLTVSLLCTAAFAADNVAPTLTMSEESGSTLEGGTKITLTVEDESKVEEVTYYWQGGSEKTITPNTNKVTINLTLGTQAGKYVFNVEAVDAEGNATGEKSYIFYVPSTDEDAPVITMSEESGSTLNAGSLITLTVEDESKVDEVTYYWQGGSEKTITPNTNEVTVRKGFDTEFIVGQQINIEKMTTPYEYIKNRTILKMEPYLDDDAFYNGWTITFDGEPVDVNTYFDVFSKEQNSGQCDELGMNSGCLIDDGRHSVIYRGIEDIFGNVSEYIDGINVKEGKIYICYDPSKYVCRTYSGDYKELEISIPDDSGYIENIVFYENNPLIKLPGKVGENYICDFFYNGSNNETKLSFGGNNDSKNEAGLWCFYISKGGENGYRLLRY